MPERKRRGEETVHQFLTVAVGLEVRQIVPLLHHDRRAAEHRKRPHAEVAFARMKFAQIEVNDPRPVVEVVAAVVRVVAVDDAGVEHTHRAFRKHRSVPMAFLRHEHFGRGEERRGKRRRSRHARVIVGTRPGRSRRMAVAVGSVEKSAHFALDFRHQLLGPRSGVGDFGRIGAHPAFKHRAVGKTRDIVYGKSGVDGSGVPEIVVGAVDVSEFFAHQARELQLSFVAAAPRGELGSHRIRLAAVTPCRLMVVNDHLAYSIAMHRPPEVRIARTVG